MPTDPRAVKLARTLMIEWGYKVQRLAFSIFKSISRKKTKRPPSTTGQPALRSQVIHFINKPMPGKLPKRTARALLDIEDAKIVPIVREFFA